MRNLIMIIIVSMFFAIGLTQKGNAVTYNFNQPQQEQPEDVNAEIEKASQAAEQQLGQLEKIIDTVSKKLETIMPKIKKIMEDLQNAFQKLQKSTEENVIKPAKQAK